MKNSLDKLLAGNGLSIGLELPLDNDWSPAGDAARRAAGRSMGVPDLARHATLARMADRLGFRALWARDVPLYDPAFGDAAQVFEVFSYLGYLAGVTDRILLGTAAVVLPLREPMLTLKSAATIDQLSGGRLLMGIASGDRPVEYPLFDRSFATRGQVFRDQVAMIRRWGSADLPEGVALLPRPLQAPLPLLVAGLAQQTPQWIGTHLDGCLAYPGAPENHQQRIAQWRAVAGPDKPYLSFIHLDLDENPDTPLERFHFGGRMGRIALTKELAALRAVGVQHIALHLRRNRRPLAETMEEIAQHVLPMFHVEHDIKEVLHA